MVGLRGVLGRVLPVVLIAVVCSSSYAQDSSSDQARAHLKQGIREFEILYFKQARVTLGNIQREYLSEEELETLDTYLKRTNDAILRQSRALEALRKAQEAMKGGDLGAAGKGFEAAASSEYLPGKVRRLARDKLVLVRRRIEAEKRAEQSKAPVKLAMEPSIAAPSVLPERVETKPPIEEAPPSGRLLTTVQHRRGQAQKFLIQGKVAMSEGRDDEARSLFRKALALAPDFEEPRELLNRLASREPFSIPGDAAEPKIMSKFLEKRRVLKQRAQMELEKAMERAREILRRADNKADFVTAEDAVQLAQDTIETNKVLYTAEEYNDRMLQIDGLRRRIITDRRRWEMQQALKQQRDIEHAEALRIAREQQQKQERIQRLTEQSKTLTSQHDYKSALELVEEILKIDPTDSYARDNQMSLQQLGLLAKEAEVKRLRSYNEMESMVDLQLAEIPWYKLLMFPDHWKQLSEMRQPFRAGAEMSPEDVELLKKLDAQILEVSLSDVEFEKVANWLYTVSGANIVINWPALEAAGLDRLAMLVNLRINNVRFKKVLELVLQQAGGTVVLGYVVDEGVILISTKEDLEQKTYTKVYDIRDLIFSVPNAPRPEGLGLPSGDGGTTGGTGTSGGSGGSGGTGFSCQAGGGGGGGGGGGEEEGLTKAELI